jgi:hypothetical protein
MGGSLHEEIHPILQPVTINRRTLRANTDETSTPRKFTLEGDR